MSRPTFNIRLFIISVLVLTLVPRCDVAQTKAVYDRGELGLNQLLKRLNTSATVLMIGAHPDDEDTALLTYLSRGENARTAYLSLTRGDGGQNILGPELGEALGVIRTEELLQARRLDGAEQFFTRAYDFGFSKTLEETRSKWNENVVLCDVVRVIRSFRPLVVIAQFTGTPSDGHGQHQFAGYIAPIAAKVAADPKQCTAAGAVWRTSKFYVRHGFRGEGQPALRINTGKYDPGLGRSYFEIAMEARSQHKSQEQGVLELKGDQFSGLNLAGTVAKENGVFDGLDTSVSAIPKITSNDEPALVSHLRSLQEALASASRSYDPNSPVELVPLLVKAAAMAKAAWASTADPASRAFIEYKQLQLLDAIKLAAGIQIDALSSREALVPGEGFRVSTRVFFPPSDTVKVKSVSIRSPRGWRVEPSKSTPEATTGARRETARSESLFDVTVADSEIPTQPYWLSTPRNADLFHWSNDTFDTLPFQGPLVVTAVTMEIGGEEFVLTQPVEFRFAHDVRGEVRRDLAVVPRLSVKLDRQLMIIPVESLPYRPRIVMSVTNNAEVSETGRTVIARLRLIDAVGKDVLDLSSREITFKKRGEKATVVFDGEFGQDLKPGAYKVRGQVSTRGPDTTAYLGYSEPLQYLHIQTHWISRPAEMEVRVLDVKVSPVTIGYIIGSGDAGPDAIGQLGLTVDLLGENDLSTGDLSKYDVIVVGIRASETRPDFVANNGRLLDYVRNGGSLIVQYQRPIYAQQGLLPFPAQIGPRVVDEAAPVTVLRPNHPLFNSPNKLTGADFTGWVQERNLYSFSTFDSSYVPLLESHDKGEPENKGGLVIANHGKGIFVYCSYSLFRQLPAGVPGAYRLLANLVDLPLSIRKQKP